MHLYDGGRYMPWAIVFFYLSKRCASCDLRPLAHLRLGAHRGNFFDKGESFLGPLIEAYEGDMIVAKVTNHGSVSQATHCTSICPLCDLS
jgi:hypothetical protein